MYSTCNLFAYSLLTFVTFVSHVLTGALPNVVSESKFEALGRGYDCSVSNPNELPMSYSPMSYPLAIRAFPFLLTPSQYSSGVFMSNVITGECPAGVTSDGKSSIDVYCGADDQYSDTDRCEQAKAEVAGTSLAIICYGILLVLSLFVFCMGGRRASKRAFYLLFVVSLLGLVFATVSLIVFQDRTKDEVDDYG